MRQEGWGRIGSEKDGRRDAPSPTPRSSSTGPTTTRKIPAQPLQRFLITYPPPSLPLSISPSPSVDAGAASRAAAERVIEDAVGRCWFRNSKAIQLDERERVREALAGEPLEGADDGVDCGGLAGSWGAGDVCGGADVL